MLCSCQDFFEEYPSAYQPPPLREKLVMLILRTGGMFLSHNGASHSTGLSLSATLRTLSVVCSHLGQWYSYIGTAVLPFWQVFPRILR